MATTSDFRNGLCIEFNNGLYTIVGFQHVKPGKGPAFVRTRLKSVNTGKVIDNTFSAGVKINVARIERRPFQYLYNDETGFHFMHTETFEQIFIEKALINAPGLLKEGQGVEIVYHADNEAPLSCELPAFVELSITYTEPGVKGDTATNTLKPATLETGTIIKVPLFLNEGDFIKVDTRKGEYVERVRS
jgi:elongation factor P